MKININKVSLIVWIVTIIVLVASTLVRETFYDQWWFVALLFVFAATALFNIIIRKLWRRPVVCAIHTSVILILLGGFLSFTTSQNGSLKVSPENPANIFSDENNQYELPFNVNLRKFDIVYYPGTMSHADYVSYVYLTDKAGNILKEDAISMNNIMKYNGYRFFNEDFEEDLSGCTLSVEHDPLGITVTYIGYVLLFISLIIMMLFPTKSQQECSCCCKMKGKNLAVLLVLMLIGSAASAQSLRTIPKEAAAELGDIYIYYSGRISPMQSFAKDFTVKLYGTTSYEGYNAEQVLAGWIFYPGEWKGTERQVSKRDEIKHLVESFLTGKLLKIYPCHQEDGTVKWYSKVDDLPRTLSDDEWTFVRKSWSYVTELVVKKDYAAYAETLHKIKAYQEKYSVALDGTTSLPSKTQFKAEKMYNAWSKYNYIAYLALGFGILLFAVYCGFTAAGKQVTKSIVNIAISINWVLFAFLTLLIILRWIVAGHIPLAKSAETQHFMAWVSLLFAGCIVIIRNRKNELVERNNSNVNTISTGLIVCGLMMMVAVMSSANPKITPLMPVLASPLLGLHVAVIMVAYALLAFMLINGLAALTVRLCNKNSDAEMARMAEVSRAMLIPAVTCLAAGIMIGAIWANVSWGTYWGWDPKETWSLITLMIYAIPLHKEMAPGLQKPMRFHLFCVLAFLSVLVTYFGVNYILGGMHSYA